MSAHHQISDHTLARTISSRAQTLLLAPIGRLDWNTPLRFLVRKTGRPQSVPLPERFQCLPLMHNSTP